MVDYHDLYKVNLFKGVPDIFLQNIARYFVKELYRKNDQIYALGDLSENIYFILSGTVILETNINDSDNYHHLSVVIEGDALGVGEIALDEYYVNAVASSPCVLFRMTKEHFFEYCMKESSINFKVVTLISELVRNFVIIHEWQGASEKFNYFLVNLCKEFGEETARGIMIRKSISYEKTAKILDLSDRHVIRLFNAYTKNEVLKKDRNNLYVSRQWFDSCKKNSGFALDFSHYFDDRFEL